MTPDGSKIVFSSEYQLVAEDRNRRSDVYIYDRASRTHILVSADPDGRPGDSAAYGSSVSDDGRFVAFSSGSSDLVRGDANGRSDVFVRDLQQGSTTRVGEASYSASISADGTRVAFVSDADDLVPDDTNRAADAFVRDLEAGTTTRASVSSTGEQLQPYEYCESASCFRDGAEQAEISGDGDTVVFVTHANGLVAHDQNNNVDAYVHDLSTGITERISEPTGGGEAYPDETHECGDNGQCFGFIATSWPAISHDGTWVFFLSGAPEMTDEDDDDFAADSDVFVHDRTTGVTQLVNRRPDGSWAPSHNLYAGSISPDGRWVTYSSDARRIAPDQKGENGDVFLQELRDASFGR